MDKKYEHLKCQGVHFLHFLYGHKLQKMLENNTFVHHTKILNITKVSNLIGHIFAEDRNNFY